MRTRTLAGRLCHACWKHGFLSPLILLAGCSGGPADGPATAALAGRTTAATLDVETSLDKAPPRFESDVAQRIADTGTMLASLVTGVRYIPQAGAGARKAPVIALIGVKGNARVDNPLVFGAAFTDIDRRDTHLARWSWGDGSQAPASIHGRNGAGSIEGRHAYRKAGIYTVKLTVLDSGGKRASATRQVVVRGSGGQALRRGGASNENKFVHGAR